MPKLDINNAGNKAILLEKSFLSTHNPLSDKHKDSLQVLNSIRAFPDQITQVLVELSTSQIPGSCSVVDDIVVSGMGGSALGGHIIKALERQSLRIPLVISSNYHLPNFVNEKSLVILSSYSGDTQETLSACIEAKDRKAQIFVISTGGKLTEMAENFNLPHYIFDPKHNPSGQPRLGIGYNIMSIYCLLSRCQLIDPIYNLNELVTFLRSQNKDEECKILAGKLKGRIVCIFASEHLTGVAHDFANQINENSKNLSFYWELPDANHHLMEGLTFPKSNSDNLMFIFLTSKHYQPETIARYAPTQQLLTKQHIPFETLNFSAINPLFESLQGVQSGAYLSYYLSQENAVDPGPVPWVDWFKEQL